MRKREFETFCEKLLDVRTLDEVGVFDFDNFEDLESGISRVSGASR